MKKDKTELLKTTLFESMNQLMENKNEYFNKPETAFSRTQKISFQNTMLFPIIATNESTFMEMLDFFPSSKLPTAAAMDYRRGLIKPSAFKALLTNFTEQLSAEKKFKGLRLIACDGTRLNTPYNPKDPDSFVKAIENRKGFNQYHLNTCYDIMNDLFIDAEIQGYYSMNEKAAFCDMMDRYPKTVTSIFTADRGYASYNVVAHAFNNNQYFVIRLSVPMAENLFENSKELSTANEFDVEDDIHIGRVRTRATHSLKNYHYISTFKTYDYIPAGSKEIDSFRVREIKIILPGGGVEYLLTNLPKSNFSTSDIKEIYRLRWGIETSFRYLKYVSGAKYLHSIKQDFIFQEIYAKLIGYNFCAALLSCVSCKNTAKTKHTYTPDKTYVFKICIRFLKGKLKNIHSLIEKRKVPDRAGRKFERKIRRQHADTLQYR